MKRLSMYCLPMLLCLLVLSGCARERAGRSVAEIAAQAGATALPVLAPVPTLALAGGPPLASAPPAPSTAEAPCPETGPSPSLRCDKEVLLAVRDRLRDEHRELLRSWHPDNAVQAFEGVTVGSGEGGERVVGLQWIGWWADPQVRLVGSIPPELGRLSELAVLDLAGNGLTGSIPEELGQLALLRELYLNANRLTGVIPEELGQLAQLQSLRLNHNQLTGPLPPTLGQLTPLRELRLGHNRLTGPLPPWLGQLTRLEMLDLGHNQLTGPIPVELGQLALLRALYLHANRLTGPLPAELGQLVRLQWLNVSHNRLTGPIPTALEQLGQMRALYLHANEVTGPVPTELEQRVARHKLFLHLHVDEMTESQQEWSEPCPAVGPSPNQRCDKEILLAVRDRLRGEHRELLRTWHPDNHIVYFQGVGVTSGEGGGRVVGLHWIGWWSDPEFRLVGSLSPELSRLPELTYVVLRENGLRGPIPPEWGQLTHMEVLDLAGNELTGSIPPTLDRLTLKRLALSGNQLTGPIPPTLRRYRNLRELNLSRNGLEGPILVELEKPGQLPELNGSHIRLPGPISPPLPASCPETGPSPSLRCDKEVLLAVRGRLRGRWHDLLRTWQPDIGIENFEGVILGGDPRRVIGLEIVRERSDASGVVPWQLSRLPRLERLVLRGNGLQGLIPPALGQLPRLRTLDLSGNWLRGTIPAELGQLRELRELHLQDNPFLTGCIPPALAPACDCPFRLCE